jgi:hypothetical protein
MNVGEILDHTFKMFGEQFKPYLGISALGIAPLFGCALLALLLYNLLGKTTAAIFALVATIPIITAVIAMEGAIIKKTSLQIFDQSITIAAAYRFGFHKGWPLFFGGLLFGLSCMIGFILLFVPGIYLEISFFLFAQAIIIEEKGAWSALVKSWSTAVGGVFSVFCC